MWTSACGRGLLAIGAAKRLKTGKVTGIDVWNPQELSGNSADAAKENAKAEGVAVIDVPDNSIAARYGFHRGDVIVTVNGEQIAKTRDLERAAGEALRAWSVTIVRGGQRISRELRG